MGLGDAVGLGVCDGLSAASRQRPLGPCTSACVTESYEKLCSGFDVSQGATVTSALAMAGPMT